MHCIIHRISCVSVVFILYLGLSGLSRAQCYPGLGDCGGVNSSSGQRTPQFPIQDSYDPVNAVKAFYLALSKADGVSASAWVVPEKRGIGAYNATNISDFFAKLREPLKIVSIERTSNDFVNVKYKYTKYNGTVCLGDAKVNTIFSDGKTMIQGISANC